jgi:hypothetical protein
VMGQKLKNSRRANVFCSSLNNGHLGRVMSASCLSLVAFDPEVGFLF